MKKPVKRARTIDKNKVLYIECMSVHPQILIPNMKIIGNGAFGRQLGHEGGTLVNGISTLKKDIQRVFLPFCEEMTLYEPGRKFLPDTECVLSWAFQPSEL